LGSGPVIDGDIEDGVGIFGYEPRINVSDKVSMSVRVEFGFVQIENEFETFTESFRSLELFGDYYLLNKEDNRLFLGLGAGMMGPPQGSNTFGISPRIGYELGRLRVSVTYNQMPFYKRKVPKYIGITFGITLGGRWKDSLSKIDQANFHHSNSQY